jgi:hypothetical protein
MDPRAIARDGGVTTTGDLGSAYHAAYDAYDEARDQLWQAYDRFERLTLRFAGALWSTPAQQCALEEAFYDGASALQRVQETLARTPGAALTSTLRSTSLARRPPAPSRVGAGQGDLTFDAADAAG